MNRINIRENYFCSFCKMRRETMEHLFYLCPYILELELDISGMNKNIFDYEKGFCFKFDNGNVYKSKCKEN